MMFSEFAGSPDLNNSGPMRSRSGRGGGPAGSSRNASPGGSPHNSPGHSPIQSPRGIPLDQDGDENRGILQEDGWAVIDSFFDEKELAHQQLGSFNDFMTIQMLKCADNHPPIEIRPTDTYEADMEFNPDKSQQVHRFTLKDISRKLFSFFIRE